MCRCLLGRQPASYRHANRPATPTATKHTSTSSQHATDATKLAQWHAPDGQ
jgi:hypothetical protein